MDRSTAGTDCRWNWSGEVGGRTRHSGTTKAVRSPSIPSSHQFRVPSFWRPDPHASRGDDCRPTGPRSPRSRPHCDNAPTGPAPLRTRSVKYHRRRDESRGGSGQGLYSGVWNTYRSPENRGHVSRDRTSSVFTSYPSDEESPGFRPHASGASPPLTVPGPGKK